MNARWRETFSHKRTLMIRGALVCVGRLVMSEEGLGRAGLGIENRGRGMVFDAYLELWSGLSWGRGRD